MDLLTYFGFYNPLRTVWYIQAGTVDEEGLFTSGPQASAVLISVRKKDGTTKKVLVTARHGLRQHLKTSPVTFGPVMSEFRAWAPGWILAKKPLKVTYSDLSPDKELPIENLNDIAFLELPDGQQGFEEAQLAEDIQVRPRNGIRIIGFNGGLNPADDGFEIRAFDSRKWDFTHVDQGTRRAFLQNGIGGGAPGCSGGGVFLPFSIFRQPSLIGVYRGMEGMNHLFMPTTWLREHLSTKEALVIEPDWGVTTLIRFLSLLLWVIVGAVVALVSSQFVSPLAPLWLLGLATLVVVALLPLPTQVINSTEFNGNHSHSIAKRRKLGLLALAAAFTMTTLWASSRTTVIDFIDTGKVEFFGCIPSAVVESGQALDFSDFKRLEVSSRGGSLVVRWTQNKPPRDFSFRAFPDGNNNSRYTAYRGSDFVDQRVWSFATHLKANPHKE